MMMHQGQFLARRRLGPALVGPDPETDEYDRRPIVTDFLMLAVLAAGLPWVVS